MDKEKIVVVSTNNNPDYLFYVPYIEKAWNSLGWRVCFMVTADVDVRPESFKFNSGKNIIMQLPDITELRKETIAQAGRLYAASYLGDDYFIMTSDIDLLPLTDYWKPNPDKVTIYGHDLTWRSYYPMGYVAMTGDKWKKYMQLTGDVKADMIRDAKLTTLPYAQDWDKWWNHDWQLLTDRLKPHAAVFDFVDRGQIQIAGATLAKGRVDRYNWKETQNQPDWIDAHCHNLNVLHPDKLNDFLSIYEKIYGKL